MNAGNRALGRIAIIVVGLVMLVGGIGTLLVAFWPPATSFWRANGPDVLAPLGSHADTGSRTAAWWIVIVAALVVGILAIVVLSTRGGGRTDTVLQDGGVAGDIGGDVRIASTAVQRAVSDALGESPQISSVSVDVYRVRRAPSLRIRVHPRRGAEPRGIVEEVERIVADLDAMLGVRLPVLLHLAHGGVGTAKPVRVR